MNIDELRAERPNLGKKPEKRKKRKPSMSIADLRAERGYDEKRRAAPSKHGTSIDALRASRAAAFAPAPAAEAAPKAEQASGAHDGAEAAHGGAHGEAVSENASSAPKGQDVKTRTPGAKKKAAKQAPPASE